MYIEERYWGEYIGGTDDSLTLLAHLARKETVEVALTEILSDFGIRDLSGSFRETEEPLVFTDDEGWETEIHYAIDLLTDLAALLLESRVGGGVDLLELDGTLEPRMPDGRIRVTAGPEELAALDRILADFEVEPLAYDLSEMVPEEDMEEMAALCGELRRELRES